MSAGSTSPTLLNEWRARRDRLARGGDGPALFAREQIRVLDYLIRRYQDSPEARQVVPARPRMDLQVAQRAIVVHHHLWEGKVSGVKTRQEAESRVSEILGRLHSHGSAAEPDDSALSNCPFDDPEPGGVTYNPLVWNQIVRWTRMGMPPADAMIAAALTKNPFLPQSVAEHLYRRIVKSDGGDLRAASLLVRGRNRIAVNYAVFSWRELTQSGRMQGPLTALYEFLSAQGPRGTAADAVRLALAHDSVQVRMAALNLLARIGDLEDIGMLSDLLSLPPAPDEHPKERAAIARTMRRIAERAHWSQLAGSSEKGP